MARQEELWSLVLAGGEGERTRTFIEQWLGKHKPKQYCTFVGNRSMFQHTVDRADCVTASQRRVTVAAQSHREEVHAQLQQRLQGHLLLQPTNRGTGPGIFLPLTYIRNRDPNAIVTVFPSDHFIHTEEHFVKVMIRAVEEVRREPRRAILLGVPPTRPETDYGYVIPVSSSRERERQQAPRPVARFVEKPSSSRLSEVMRYEGLWNTFIMVGRVSTFWELGVYFMPEVLGLFNRLSRVIGSSKEPHVLKEIYQAMPTRDFSRRVLQHCLHRLAVMPMMGVSWDDWGRPERIVETLRRLGKDPAFPLECLKNSKREPSPDTGSSANTAESATTMS